jgi:SAM-dependent methyltransferase
MIKTFLRRSVSKLIGLLPARIKLALVRLIGQQLSTPELQRVLMALISQRANQLPAEDALRFVYGIDNALYPIESAKSVAYGQGVHSKHRHMQYHTFFTKRIVATDRVLDIGSGIGALAHSIATQTGAQVTGIEYNADHVRTARERYQTDRIQYIEADIYQTTLTDQFDVIVMSNVLEHLTDRPNLLRRIQSMTGAQRFLIRVPRFDRHWSVPLKKELGIEWRLDEDHKIEYTPEIFAAEMHEAGLNIQHVEYRWDEIWADLTVAGA